MTISNAKKFIHRAIKDKDLRAAVNKSADMAGIQSVLSGYDLVFTEAELDEAYHNLLTQCATEDDAGLLKEFVMWWQMVQSGLTG